MIVFIVAGILLFIPDSWLIDLSGFSIPASWKPFIFIFFLLSSILLLFDIVTHFKKASDTTKIKNYELDETNGWFSHKKRGGNFCPKCLSRGEEIPLMVDQVGWECPVCGDVRITKKGPELFGTFVK
jgi:hypothetical protein